MSKTIKLSLISVALISSLYADEVIKLQPITVTSATKSSQSLDSVTSNINVITSEEIEEKHYTTVTDALNSLSGISFTNNGGLGKSTSVQVRGFDTKRVLVLIDGVRYNDNTSTGGAAFSDLMIADVERIEVVKGAQSGIWGADATAGVINIITKSSKKGTHASVSYEYGEFNTKKHASSVSHRSDNYYVKFSTQRVDTDGFTARAPRDEDISKYEKDGYENTTSNIKLGVSISDTNKIDISHTTIDSKTEYDSSNPDDNSSSTAKHRFSKINFNHIDSFNEVDIYANRSTFSREYLSSSSSRYDGEVLEYGAKSNILYRESDFLVIGVDAKTFEQDDKIKNRYSNQALFITNSNIFDGIIGGETILTESIRVDAYDKFDDKTTGKLGLKHFSEYIDGFTASANIGTAYNVPTLFNLYSAYGSTEITPESTKSYDVSLEYRDIKLSYFSSTITDMIDFDMSTYKYNNIVGESKIKGYEVEYATSLNDVIALNANYTRVNAKDKDSKDLPRRAKESVKASIDYYATEALHLGLNGEYVGERFDKADKKGQQTGKYTLANFVANYELTKNFQIYAKVDNITNKYYQVVDGYATAPRSAYIGMKANF